MTWIKHPHNLPNRPVKNLCAEAQPWLIRGSEFLCAYDDQTQRILWQSDLSADHAFAGKHIIRIGKVAVTSTHLESDPRKVALSAFSQLSGELLWQSPVDWKLSSYMGGLQRIDQSLLVIQGLEIPRLTWIDPLTGAISATASGAPSVLTGLSVKNKVFYTSLEAGLYQVDKGISLLIDGSTRRVRGCGDTVYALSKLSDGQKTASISWFAVDSPQQQEQFSLPFQSKLPNLNIVTTAATTPELVVVLCREGHGISLIDLAARKILWQVAQDEQWIPSNALWTPHGLIVTTKGRRERGIRCIDVNSGAFLPAPAVENKPNLNLYWTGDKLLVDTMFGLEVFTWG